MFISVVFVEQYLFISIIRSQIFEFILRYSSELLLFFKISKLLSQL